jgi:hypothetical protein
MLRNPRSVVPLLALALFLLAACGSTSPPASAGAKAPASTAASSSTTSAPSSTSSPTASGPSASASAGQPSSTASPGSSSSPAPSGSVSLRAGDTVICRAAPEPSPATGISLTISRYVPEGNTEQLVRAISTTKIMPGWSPNLAGACGGPLSWTPDFTKVLIDATPPGAAAGAGTTHMVLIDSVAQTMVDLTAARTGSGFSGGLPNDASPLFVADSANRKITFGSHRVLFTDNNQYKILDVRSPRKATPVALPFPYATHPEYQLVARVFSSSNSYNTVSPDGAYIYHGTFGAVTDVVPSMGNPNCPGGGAVIGSFLGWRDARHAVVTGNQFLGLVTVNGPKLSCTSLLPPSGGRVISQYQITPDARHVILTTNGPAGNETYEVSTTLPVAEPTKLATAPSLAPGAVLFFPGNY